MAQATESQGPKAASPFASISTLKERGWTDGKIRSVLGEPDKLTKNPHYATAAPMRLYALERVEAAEQTPEWQDWYQKTLARRQRQSATSTAIAAAKREALIAQVLERLQFHPPEDITNKRELAALAREEYTVQKAAFMEERGRWETVTLPSRSSPGYGEFMRRITINMLRHGFSNYDDLCLGLAGKIGRAEAYDALRPHIDALALEWMRSLKG